MTNIEKFYPGKKLEAFRVGSSALAHDPDDSSTVSPAMCAALANSATPPWNTEPALTRSRRGRKWRLLMCKTLILPIKKKWFDMIKSGQKTEEYRAANEYWATRLVGKGNFAKWDYCGTKEFDLRFLGFESLTWTGNLKFLHFDKVVFTLGYPKANDTERRLEFKNPRIKIGAGRPEWGAEHGKTYFVITWD